MTIQEAIKSGKPFRRKIWANWTWTTVDICDFIYLSKPKFIDSKYNVIDADDILAEDWEIKSDG